MPLTSRQAITFKPFLQQPLHITFIIMFAAYWLYSAITTPDLLNWITENILTLSLLIFLISFYNIFRFSDISYTLIFMFLVLHVYGSQYQYSDNPLGEWMRQQFGFQRNNYDRLVHFGFGLLLSYPIHEVLALGLKVKWFASYLLPVEFVLSLGALYELAEWAVADIIYNGTQQGMDFLGMQGDVWDAQKDIALGFAGSVIAMTLTFILQRRKR